jgi:hypothetical protein
MVLIVGGRSYLLINSIHPRAKPGPLLLVVGMSGVFKNEAGSGREDRLNA